MECFVCCCSCRAGGVINTWSLGLVHSEDATHTVTHAASSHPDSAPSSTGRHRAPADVVVLGGGIIGAAIARELARRGVGVAIVDASEPGTGTSGRCDGNLLVQTKHDALGVRMTQYSLERYAQWQDELAIDIQFEQRGSTVFFTDEAEAEAVAERARWLASQGVSARVLGSRELHELEPGLSDRALGGIDCLDDASAYPPYVVAALVHDALEHGAQVVSRTRATRLLRAANGDVEGVETDRGPIAAKYVVNALGPWSPQFDGDPGVAIPVAPRQGVLAVTEKLEGLVNRTVTEGSYMSARASAGHGDVASVSFVAEPTFAGNLLIGSTRRFCGYDTTVDLDLLARIMAHAIPFLPALEGVQLIRSFAGLRPWTPDNMPLIGASRTAPGYLVATGHEGEGIGLAPITADIIAGLVAGEELSPLLAETLARTDPHRFSERSVKGTQ